MGRYPQQQAHVLLWVAVLTVMALGGLALEDSEVLQERARYYMRELDKTLQELGTSSSVHILHKRSASLPQDCDELVKHTQKTCPNWAITAEEESLLEFFSDSKLPDLFVSKVTGKQDGESLKLQLEIVHNSEVVVMETRVIESQKRILAPPKTKSDGLPVSIATFTFNTSSCSSSNQPNKDVIIVPVGKINHIINVELEICEQDFDTTHHTHFADEPMLKILNDPGDTIVIEQGKDVSLEMVLRLNMISEYKFMYELWNWRQRKWEHARAKIELDHDHEYGVDYDKEKRLFSLEILDARNINSGESGLEAYTKEVKLRLTVKLGSEEMSGYLYIQHDYETKGLGRHKIIDEMTNDRIISLRLPYKVSAIPPNMVSLSTSSSLGCQTGNNKCTVSCTAYGADVTSVFVLKREEFEPPIRSATHVIDNYSIEVIQEVNPPPEKQEHQYRCVAVLKNGQSSSKDFSVVGKHFYGNYY